MPGVGYITNSIMEVYLLFINLSTIISLLLFSLGLFGYRGAEASDFFDDDFGADDLGVEADLLLNTLASAFMNTPGEAGEVGECEFKCPNGKPCL